MTTASATYVKWGRPRNAFHIVEETGVTLCGRHVEWPYESRDTLPAAKSCESCLRLARRREDTR